MKGQLSLFTETEYKAYWRRFYAVQLKKAEESRNKKIEPTLMISINPKNYKL